MTDDEYGNLAFKYAPIFAQKVSDEWQVADQIAPVDFAGKIEHVMRNPDKLYDWDRDKTIRAKVYYSVCETTTHYFLIYAVYHVLDWWKRYEPQDLYNLVRDMLDEHIHDMEGALLVVTKEPAKLVDGLVTVSHRNFYLYAEPKIPVGLGRSKEADKRSFRIAKFNETVDGNIWLDKATKRVKLYIQSRGHGIRGDHKGWGGGNKTWYYRPAGEKKTPGTLDRKEKKDTRAEEYLLEDIFCEGGLWAHRFDKRVFGQNKNGQWGFIYFDEKRSRRRAGEANPPWSWNDHNDSSPIGAIATDPAQFIIRYAQGWGPVSTHYVYNPYQSIGP